MQCSKHGLAIVDFEARTERHHFAILAFNEILSRLCVSSWVLVHKDYFPSTNSPNRSQELLNFGFASTPAASTFFVPNSGTMKHYSIPCYITISLTLFSFSDIPFSFSLLRSGSPRRSECRRFG